jgi:hypothetical protein
MSRRTDLANRHGSLRTFPSRCQSDLLEFLRISTTPERKGTRASAGLASVSIELAGLLSAEARH